MDVTDVTDVAGDFSRGGGIHRKRHTSGRGWGVLGGEKEGARWGAWQRASKQPRRVGWGTCDSSSSKTLENNVVLTNTSNVGSTSTAAAKVASHERKPRSVTWSTRGVEPTTPSKTHPARAWKGGSAVVLHLAATVGLMTGQTARPKVDRRAGPAGPGRLGSLQSLPAPQRPSRLCMVVPPLPLPKQVRREGTPRVAWRQPAASPRQPSSPVQLGGRFACRYPHRLLHTCCRHPPCFRSSC